jgi:hypothetical protein
MSVHDLIEKWEESLAEALTVRKERESELSASDLTVGAGVIVRSKVKAGGDYTKGCCEYSF